MPLKPTLDQLLDCARRNSRAHKDVESELHRLARKARTALSKTHDPAPVQEFVLAVRRWGTLYRGASEDAAHVLAGALLKRRRLLVRILRSKNAWLQPDIPCELVMEVARNAGSRVQLSFSAKVLHWLVPTHVPIHDSNVARVFTRAEFDAWNLSEIQMPGSRRYARIVAAEYALGRGMAHRWPAREPTTFLRAVDVFYFHKGRTLRYTPHGGSRPKGGTTCHE